MKNNFNTIAGRLILSLTLVGSIQAITREEANFINQQVDKQTKTIQDNLNKAFESISSRLAEELSTGVNQIKRSVASKIEPSKQELAAVAEIKAQAERRAAEKRADDERKALQRKADIKDFIEKNNVKNTGLTKIDGGRRAGYESTTKYICIESSCENEIGNEYDGIRNHQAFCAQHRSLAGQLSPEPSWEELREAIFQIEQDKKAAPRTALQSRAGRGVASAIAARDS